MMKPTTLIRGGRERALVAGQQGAAGGGTGGTSGDGAHASEADDAADLQPGVEEATDETMLVGPGEGDDVGRDERDAVARDGEDDGRKHVRPYRVSVSMVAIRAKVAA